VTSYTDEGTAVGPGNWNIAADSATNFTASKGVAAGESFLLELTVTVTGPTNPLVVSLWFIPEGE
jgi:hypothetical protein